MDTEKNLFDALPEEERAKRVEEAGDESAAILSYGQELAKKSEDREVKLTEEEKREFEQLKKSAAGILKSFEYNPANHHDRPNPLKRENLTIVIEDAVDPLVKMAFYEAARDDFGNDAHIVVVSNMETSGAALPEAAGQKMLSATNVLLIGIHSMSHSKATAEAWQGGLDQDRRKERSEASASNSEDRERVLDQWKKLYPGASIISIPDAYKESFLHECYEVDKKRIEAQVKKIEELFKLYDQAKITSPAGTEVTLTLEPDKFRTYVEKGSVGLGDGMNAPSGETAIRPTHVNGKFIVDGFCADNPLTVDEKGIVIDPIIIEFKEDQGTVIGDSKDAENLRQMCEQARATSKEAGTERDPYQIAEFAIGVLGEPDETGRINFTLVNATIDEKLSLHLAIGADHILGGENDVPIHIDFGGQFITVELTDSKGAEEPVKILKDGRLMLDETGNLVK